MKQLLSQRTRQMNTVFKLPVNDKLTNQGLERLYQFHQVLSDEVDELLDVTFSAGEPDYVALADCLADLQVYIHSEANRWGIPLDEVIDVVMDSQESKLVDGQPVMAPDGSKFIKGPNYVPPEGAITELLERYK